MKVVVGSQRNHGVVRHTLGAKDLIEKSGPAKVGQWDDFVRLYPLPYRTVNHMARPWVVGIAFQVNPMRLLTHAGVEQDRNEAITVLYPTDERSKTVRHIGNLSERGDPQRLVGRGVIDEVQKLV